MKPRKSVETWLKAQIRHREHSRAPTPRFVGQAAEENVEVIISTLSGGIGDLLWNDPFRRLEFSHVGSVDLRHSSKYSERQCLISV